MRYFCLFGLLLSAGCTPPPSESNHQNLDVAECREIGVAVAESGKLSNNLCPGYMPNGLPVEDY